MVKRLNIAFSDEEHNRLKEKKENLRKELNLKSLSWENYLIEVSK